MKNLEQWLYFLATSEIPDDADAPGLQEARQKLLWMKMNREEQQAYDRYMMDRSILQNTMVTARGEGHMEGYAEGREEGRLEGRLEGRQTTTVAIAKAMKQAGEPIEKIMAYTHLSEDEIEAL